MLNFDKIKDCCGCKACEQICPTNAIQMQINKEGFWYPIIDESKCIKCGLCAKVCLIDYDGYSNDFDKQAIACYNNNNNIRKISSSGGIFYLLAKYVVTNNGVVFGCQMTNDNRAIHSSATSIDECMKFLQSKYVQSDIGQCYIQAQSYLKNNKLVLFSGTPCQINGLKLFLQKDYDNLICVDIICHGVPSPKALELYLKDIEKKQNSKVEQIEFRNKTYGWEDYSVKIKLESQKEILEKSKENDYIKMFLRDTILRESCHGCLSKGDNRSSDITLADFWGVKELYPQIYDPRGVSLVLLQSSKGQKVFEQIQNDITQIDVDFQSSVALNPSYYKSVKPNKRKEVFDSLGKQDFDKVAKKYTKVSLGTRIKSKLRRIAKKILRR